MYGQPIKRQVIYIDDQSGYGYKTANTVLCLFLFFLSIGVFGFGIWLAAWTYNFNYASVILNYDIYRAGYILLIISGAFLMIVAFVGFCGSTQENSCLLLVFVIVIIICEFILIAVASVALVFNQNFTNNLLTNLTFSIQRTYGVNLQLSRNQAVTTAIDQLQIQFSCCGATGNTNSGTSWQLYQSSTWFATQNYGPPYVPLSCCALNSASQVTNAAYCQGTTGLGSPQAPPLLNSNTANPYLNVQGCLSAISTSVTYFSYVMFGLALATAAYLLIILVLSFCLLRRIEVSKKEMYKTNAVSLPPTIITSVNKTNTNKNLKSENPKTMKSSKEKSPTIESYNDSQKILK